MTCVVWFRQDLRLADNPTLLNALRDDERVVPVYVWDPQAEAPWSPGAASRWWLHHSLAALDADLRRRGSQLVLRKGPTLDELRKVVRESGARAVYFNERYEPAALALEARVHQALGAEGIETNSYAEAFLFQPDRLRTQAGKPYQVFTQFWRKCLSFPYEPDEPRAAPERIALPELMPRSQPLSALDLLPKINWASKFPSDWTPGEAGARKMLERFASGALEHYPERRDLLSEEGTSRLSPHLHFGEISLRQVWHAVRGASVEGSADRVKGEEAFLRQIGWREFGAHLLTHFPHTPLEPLNERFTRFPWKHNARTLRAWQRGQTGYPLVDAGMRQLWQTGWMHNRARLVVASFLVKDLMLPWQDGARWFWDTLVDADLGNNTLGWQWCAGCGADAAPYFRILNPVLQGQRFDPDGAYVRHWVPELARLPAKYIHAPWTAPAEVLRAAGVTLGRDYPQPVVDHAGAREAALDAYATMKESGARNHSEPRP